MIKYFMHQNLKCGLRKYWR